jgi:hypothetical protein
MALTSPEPPPAEKTQSEIRTFSLVPRLGLLFAGGGTVDAECEGADCNALTADDNLGALFIGNESRDYSHKPAFAIGADFLFRVGELFRIGPSIFHTFNMEVEPDGATSREIGSLTDFDFVAEVIPRVSPTVWLVPRVQAGGTMFNASGDQKTFETTAKNVCQNYSSQLSSYGARLENCGSYASPHFGYNLGIGFGALFAVASNVRLRADLLLSHYAITFYEMKATGNGISGTQKQGGSGERYFLSGGVEF